MDEEVAGYQSYMLRLWLANNTDACWRASLEDPLTGERQVFASLETLFAYLREVTVGLSQCQTQDENLEEIGS